MSKLSRIALSTLGATLVAGCVITTSDPKAPATAATSTATTTTATTATATTTARPIHRIGGLRNVGALPTATTGAAATATGTVAPVGPGVFGDSSATVGPLKGDVFWIPENTQTLPDLDKLTPVQTIWAQNLNIPDRDFKDGFPGLSNRLEWFAIRYVGQFTIATNGNYKFRIVSDDGARVYVDAALLVENDGIHSVTEKSASTKLTPGIHYLRVDYFQGPKYSIALQLFVTGPDGKEKLWSPIL